MNAFERFVAAISAEMETPALYGWFHLLFVALVVGATVLLCRTLRDADERTVRRLMLAVLAVMVTVEAYKQLVFSMEVEDGVAVWSYTFYAFPYQFCSTPIYVLPFAILLPEGRCRDAVIAYLSTFSLFGGLAVMVYPGDVFIETVGINLQTMIHHGLQVVLGIYLLVRYRSRPLHRRFLGAVLVFAILVGVALALNIGVYHALAAHYEEVPSFNMFYISPYFPCTLPLVSLIWAAVPYPVFLLIYLIGFSIAAAVMHYGGHGIIRLVGVRREQR